MVSNCSCTQVNTFDIPGRVNAWNQLEDGQILWQMLADIDADYFNDSLPNVDESHRRTSTSASDNWIPRWQNLKHIERAVSAYIREECGQLPVLTKRMIPDLKTGARDGSMMLTAKLAMAVLLASLYSPKSNQRMVKVMTDLGEKNGEVIAEAIQDLQALDQRMAALGVDQELTPDPTLSGYRTPTRIVSGAGSVIERDSGLEQEAQLFEANKDRKALGEQVTQLKRDLETSRRRIAQLEEELVEARLHLDDHGTERTSSDEVEKLRHDLARERQYIEGLEADLQNARDIVDSQKRRLERLTSEEGARQELRDQLQLVKAERDELKQKAKANENLKKKIQSLTQETKNLETLRQDYQEARERLLELEAVEERCIALEKVNKENGQTIVQCEQSIFEEKGKRTRVEHDNLVLMKQLEQTRELQYKAEEAKRELEDRIRELETSSHADRGGSLEDELTHDDSIDNLDVPSSSLALTEGRVSSDAIALQQKVDILNARLKSLENETLKQMQENLGLRADMMSSQDEESQR
jgi:protein HOOK3